VTHDGGFEVTPSEAKPRVDGVQIDVERACNLGRGHLFELGQDEDGTSIGVEVVQEALHELRRVGRFAQTLDAFVARSTRNDVLVRCADPEALAVALSSEGIASAREGVDGLVVTTVDTDRVGDVAFRAGVAVRELTRRTASLEEAFLELTSDRQQFRTGDVA